MAVYLDWKAGIRVDIVERFRDWYDLMVATVARGVKIRRARVVSEPITDFVRHEYESTADLNIAAGEQVRWLPRGRASDLMLPGNDFWLFDDKLVRFGHFAGDGTYLGQEIVADAAVVRRCSLAFESVWTKAIDHANYKPT